MGRNRQWKEDMQARFQSGTFDRIDRLKHPHETQTDFVRKAVEEELNRRKLDSENCQC